MDHLVEYFGRTVPTAHHSKHCAWARFYVEEALVDMKDYLSYKSYDEYQRLLRNYDYQEES